MPSVPPKMSPSAQNMKTGRGALGNAENEFASAKLENGSQRPRYRRKRVRARKTLKRDMTPSIPPKMSPDAQNIKTGPDTLGTKKTSPGAHNMKMGPDALGTAVNESGRAKHEIGT
jgi:hypothetical protein